MALPLLPQFEGDWKYIQAQYELGDKDVPTIARETGVPSSKIYAMASRRDWLRPDDPKAMARVEMRLAKEELERNEIELYKQQVARVNAEMQYRMLHEHRRDIAEARDLSMQLFAELREVMDKRPELEQLGEMMRKENQNGADRTNDAYRYILSFEGRVKSMEKLSNTMKNLLLLQRQAFGIKDMLEDPERPQADTPTEEAMAALIGKFNQVLNIATPAKDMGTAEVIENGTTTVNSR